MFAIQFDEPGGPDVLKIREVPRPIARDGEVIIEFEASTINPADVKIRNGQIAPRAAHSPFTLGYDIVGTVVETGGSSLTDLPVGSRALGMSAMAVSGIGTWSQFVKLSADSVAPAPEEFEAATLAQLPLAGLTALQGVQALDLAEESDVLVVGAAGAVGNLAIQLLRNRGHRVHALVRSDEQAERLPAEIDRHVGDIPDSVVDAVLDTAGIDMSDALHPGGRHVTVVPGSAAVDAKLIITRESGAMLRDLVRELDQGLRLGEPIVYPISEIRSAHAHFERGPERRIALVN
ncbi:NADP-dependent oxidoreductase [Dietzia psychralcaliphila]|uniref:NADP-dependent oxidoreductase n=1 Tax=Dietzia psychralcaliphila TaxID=139021 RepID=UPI001C1E3AD9|nr:NADP-dependent oxidoreductase [Dietzia psychralcaliphila]